MIVVGKKFIPTMGLKTIYYGKMVLSSITLVKVTQNLT